MSPLWFYKVLCSTTIHNHVFTWHISLIKYNKKPSWIKSKIISGGLLQIWERLSKSLSVPKYIQYFFQLNLKVLISYSEFLFAETLFFVLSILCKVCKRQYPLLSFIRGFVQDASFYATYKWDIKWYTIGK